MFKFSFQPTDEFTDETKADELQATENKIHWGAPAEEVALVSLHESRAESLSDSKCHLKVGDITLSYANLKKTEEAIASLEGDTAKSIVTALEENSDVISGIYEGGMKIWECTADLLYYLDTNKFHFTGKKVLDLGCGAGLLGIYAAKRGATEVVFQDYNKEVLEHVTIPNIFLNTVDGEVTKKFVAGDWGSARSILGTYDVILTSETIYNREYYPKLLDVFENCLTENGTIFVAAKSCYFGVGGSVWLFRQAVERRGTLDCQTCFEAEEGVRREILQMSRRVA